MALRTDYKNDILNTEVNAERQFEEVTNPNGTKSYRDVTEYTQVGDDFGAELVNAQNAEINAKAPLASPAFTGNPTAPTKSQSTEDDSIATTAYVKAAMVNAIDPSLSASGKAADASVTGNRITALESSVPDVDKTLSVNGAAADAKIAGDSIRELQESVYGLSSGEPYQFITNPLVVGAPTYPGTLVGNKASCTINDGVVKVSQTGTLNYFGFYSRVIESGNAYTNGHKWYVRVDGLDTSHVENFRNFSCVALKGGSSNNAAINGTEGILNLTDDCDTISFFVNATEVIPEGEYVTLTGVQLFDLTVMFGAGFEPTIEEFKAIYGTAAYGRNVNYITGISSEEKVVITHIDNVIDGISDSVTDVSNSLDETINYVNRTEIKVDTVRKNFNDDTETVTIDWVYGGINNSTGEEYDSTIRLRSSAIDVDTGDMLLIRNSENLHVLLYYFGVDGSLLLYLDAYTNTEYRTIAPTESDTLKIVVRNEDSSNIDLPAGNNIRVIKPKERRISQYIKNPLVIGAASEYGSITGNRASLSAAANGTITITNTGSVSYFGFYSSLCNVNNARSNGHKWYVRLDGFDASHVTNFTNVTIVAVRSGSNVVGVTGEKGIMTLTADCNAISVFINSSSNLSSTDYATITGFQLVDLTEMFGEGFEPDIDVFEQVYGTDAYDRYATFTDEVSNEVKAIAVQTKEDLTEDIAEANAISLNAADVAMGGILKRWTLTDTITATLYNNGILWISGKGTLPIYSYTVVPPWRTNDYMRCIRKVIIDETITINYGLYACFTQYDENNMALYYQNEYDGRIDYTPNIKCIYERDFGQFDYHHINLARHKEPFDRVQGLPIPNMYKHSLFSVPKEVCNTAFITATKNMILKANNTYNKHGVTLIITDSPIYHREVMQYVDYVFGSAYHNVASILVPDLADDGFPSYWTEPMKRSLFEVIPYIGKQYLFYKDENADRDEAYPYRAKGLAAMNTYSGYGYPEPFCYQAKVSVYYATPSDGEVLYNTVNGWGLSKYRGQPFSPSIEQIATGLSCSGFVNWVFWRYFKENFTLGASRNHNTKLGPLGNPLPLTDITFDELQPFDLLNFAYDNNKDGIIDTNDNGGHVAIFLSKYTNANGDESIVILNCGMGSGVTFGRWRFDDAWFEKEGQINTAKAMRFDKGSISLNMISHYNKDDYPDFDPDEGLRPDEDEDPDGGSEPEGGTNS